MLKKNSHCSTCGHPFAEDQPWPRCCAACGQISFLNPVPVAVALVPVDDGLLAVRRGIEPQRGRLALPGGYINLGETWQEAAAREVLEETGLSLDPGRIREFRVRSTPEGAILIFGLAEGLASTGLPPFEPTAETLERMVLKAPVELAFSLHTEMMRAFFEERG